MNKLEWFLEGIGGRLKELVDRVDNHTVFTTLYYSRTAAEILSLIFTPAELKELENAKATDEVSSIFKRDIPKEEE